MKTFLTAASLAAMAVCTPMIAQAQEATPVGAYGSIGYANTHAQGSDLGAVQARLGYRFMPVLGVEGELSGGVKSDHTNVFGTRAKVKEEHAAAIYGVGFLPVSPKADLFARVGYGTTKIKASAAGLSASDSSDSWNYGVGGQYHFDAQNGVRVDWTRKDFRDAGSGHADVWAVAYTRRF